MSIIGTIVGYGAKGIGTGISAASVVPRTVGNGLIFVGTKIVEGSDAMKAFGDGIAESGDIGLWGSKNLTPDNFNAFCVLHPDIAVQGEDAVVKAMYAEAKAGAGTAGTGKVGDPGRVVPDSGTVTAQPVVEQPVKEPVKPVQQGTTGNPVVVTPVKAEAEQTEEIPPHILAAELC